MSTHNTAVNFMKSLNHEFIHAWQFATFGRYMDKRQWDVYKEASAYTYTQLHYPSIDMPTRYTGIISLYYWPILPAIK